MVGSPDNFVNKPLTVSTISSCLTAPEAAITYNRDHKQISHRIITSKTKFLIIYVSCRVITKNDDHTRCMIYYIKGQQLKKKYHNLNYHSGCGIVSFDIALKMFFGDSLNIVSRSKNSSG